MIYEVRSTLTHKSLMNKSKHDLAYLVLNILDMIQPETCVCAAVKTECGKIIRGHRHHNCIHAITEMNLKMLRKSEGQGFMTTKNRFVTREEGAKLQNEAKIVSYMTGKPIERILFSEDLY